MSALQELEAKWGKLGSWSDLPEGWKDLVDQLLTDLSKIPGWKTIYVSQVKEKFAGLRFYINIASGEAEWVKQVSDLIEAAESKSYTLCQTCGKPGKTITSKHWWETACEEHA